MGKEVPDELIVNCFGTETCSLQTIRELIIKNFGDLNINDVIKELDLKKPIYFQTSVYGHFGNDKFP
ncbi:methionine adenosyltransferase domain-containing protein [bacterium]|nr:methionine adenosyltransferase domain-containing protein [bacterium]MBP5783330.1 methionine adenosyltransferase domain-containing protein [bacterium]